MIDRLEFVIGEALQGMRRNASMTFAAITTSATSLFLLGGMAFAYLGVSRYVSDLTDRVDIRAVMRDGATREDVSEVRRKIAMIPGIKSVVWIPKEASWKMFKERYPSSLVQGLDNPLPETFKVQVQDLSRAKEVAAAIAAIPKMDPRDPVKLRTDAQELVLRTMSNLRILGYGLGSLLLITSGILIYNTIRLAILSRRREIRIMQLVGSTRLTVAAPMAIEGFVQGALGGAFATLLVLSADAAFRGWLGVDAAKSWPKIPVGLCLGILCAVGALYGLFCAMLAMREVRKVI